VSVATSWVSLPDGSPFSAQALPYVVFSDADDTPRIGARIGDQILDLAAAAGALGLDGGHIFESPSLAPLMAAGPSAWAAVRSWVSELVTHPADEELVAPHLSDVRAVRVHAPFEVADLTCTPDHDQRSAVPPPGRHQRAGSVRLGPGVRRPCGPLKPERGGDGPLRFGPTQRLDVDAGVGFVVGTPTEPGQRVSASAFPDVVFGVVLMARWSTRDLLTDDDSFATTISPWVLPLAALDGARLPALRGQVTGLDYLTDTAGWRLDAVIDAAINGTRVARVSLAGAQWTPAQMLAQLTVTGTPLRTGDVLLVCPTEGAAPSVLDDGDQVTVRGWAPGPRTAGAQLGLGEVDARVLPAQF